MRQNDTFEQETQALLQNQQQRQPNNLNELRQQHLYNQEIQQLLRRSIILNHLIIIVSIAKIITSYIFLTQFKYECQVPLKTWIICMISHDTINLYTTSTMIQYAQRARSIQNRIDNNIQNNQNNNIDINNNNNINNTNINNSNNDLNRNNNDINNIRTNDVDQQNGFQQINNDDVESFGDQEQGQRQPNYNMLNSMDIYHLGHQSININDLHYIRLMKRINEVWFTFLFVIGNVLLFTIDHDCNTKAPELTTLSLIYLIFGFFTLCYPLIGFTLICLCLPCLLVLLLTLGGTNQKPADQEMINKLEAKKYNQSDLKGDQECCICCAQYTEDDMIIQLPCNEKHYFHKDCIKQWLEINGVCPICRKRLDGQEQVNQSQ